MGKLSNPKFAKEIMNEAGFRTQKKYGQNFLMDEGVLIDIVEAADITEDDFVIEIGPGIGTLSEVILERAYKALLIEIDDKLIPILNKTLGGFDNVKIVNTDIMKIDLDKLIEEESEGRKVKIVANLPYYITTPILMKILRGHVSYESITVMVQKEVAERMEAKPGSKDYGALSLAVQFYTEPEIIEKVPAGKFFPPPKVDSAVITLRKKETELPDSVSEELLFSIIRSSFEQRRKALYNGLVNHKELGLNKEKAKKAITELGWPETIRGEKLTLKDFIKLSEQIAITK
ncbi:MAG: 16S rRNA (adenine(1518)-N(6)/adenine(1519)-N(6))-dimethyltransferase RsmA [Lachnospiraceae bacterium]|nr:16S rRNA (adenine(1518)-N(6)/adenine(1519)-N(6))-dimethyltransferase RsmA [Lachnospiraceae bacterium]